jgi:hypothetical protein
MPSNSPYIPGTCNIGQAEIKLRKFIGWLAAGVTLLVWAGLSLAEVASEWRLLVFFPATVAALGYLQAAAHFCVKFGLAGVFNFGPNVGRTDTVEQAEFRRQDRRTALRIIGYALLIAAFVTAAAYLVPT